MAGILNREVVCDRERRKPPALVALILGILLIVLLPASAAAISAPIHIANTGGEGIFIRPEANTSRAAIGWIPEGASPDYHCFAWGQSINGVPIWFNVTYGGVTGFYASYYDDSSYHSNEELTAKYGVPLCETAPSPPTAAPPTPAPTPSAPAPGSRPTFKTMNAAGGIYWRSAPDWNTPVAITGNGVYEGTTVAISCYQVGTSVPGSNNTIWEQGEVIAGPGSGHGWINAHFIDDGAPINQPSPGVPSCNEPPPATTAPPKAPPRATEQVLVPDPAYWCLNADLQRHFGLQIREAKWKVLFAGLRGTPHQNDWKCSYLVQMTFPGPSGQNGPLPPTHQQFPINFREVCTEQFPGSRLQYELGPIYSAAWPWVCLGQAGKYYPPPTLRISTLLSNGGFQATGVPAASAGSLTLQLQTIAPGRVRPTAEAGVFAAGSRSVRHRGRYSLKVRLTPFGRRHLRRAGQLHARFTLRFKPRAGATRVRSTQVKLHR